MSRFLDKALLGGQQVDFLLWLSYCCLFLAFFLPCSQLFRGTLCHGPTFADPMKKSETDSKEDFLGQKIDKTGIDSK